MFTPYRGSDKPDSMLTRGALDVRVSHYQGVVAFMNATSLEIVNPHVRPFLAGAPPQAAPSIVNAHELGLV